MFEAYKVGVSLYVNNQITPVLSKVINDFEKLEKLAKSVNKSFDLIAKSSTGIDKTARSVQNLNNQLLNTINRAERAAAAMAGMGAVTGYQKTQQGKPSAPFYAPIVMPGTTWQSGRSNAYQASQSPFFQQMALPSPANRPAMFNYAANRRDYIEGVYSRVDDNDDGRNPRGNATATAAGAASGGNGGGRRTGGNGGGRYGGYALAAAAGRSAKHVFAPYVPLAAGVAIYEANKNQLEYDREQTKLKMYGMSAENNRALEEYAKKLNIKGVNQMEALRLSQEALGTFRESGQPGEAALKTAKIATPFLARVHAITAAIKENGMSTTQELEMLRFIEQAGGSRSAKDFEKWADLGYRLNVTSGGQVDYGQLRQFMSTANAAKFGLSPEGLMALEPVMAAMKGGRTGWSFSTTYRRIMGTQAKMDIAGINQFIGMGLWDASKVPRTRGGKGGLAGLPKPGFMKEPELFASNPAFYYEKHIMPYYKKNKTSDAEIARINDILFGRTGGGMFTHIQHNIDVIHKSIEALKKTPTIEGAYNIAMQSDQAKLNTVMMDYDNLLKRLGETTLPATIKALEALEVPLKWIVDAIDSLPNYNRYGSGTDRLFNGIGNTISRSVKNWTEGTSISDKQTSTPNWNDIVTPMMESLRAQRDKPVTLKGDVILDNKKVGKVMFKGITAPQAGPSAFDKNLGLIYPSAQ